MGEGNSSIYNDLNDYVKEFVVMHTARFVDEKAVELKNKVTPLFEAAWKLALYCVGWP